MAANNLGTAYIKIAPQMQGIQKSISDGLASIKTSSLPGAAAVGTVVAKGVSAAMNLVTSSLDGAIKRTDILNNFPRVMSNLGIGAEDAQKSIDRLVEGLDGLPTALQDGAAAVQRFTSRNNDVAKSTEIFLALNNAILAGGASAEIQSSALEQMSQAYAKGKPDMMEWRTMMMAMPAQLNQVAESMGFGKNAADKLGESLRKGETSMDDFLAEIIKLNGKGVNGLASFEEQARGATAGIGTALTNMRNRATNAISKIIQAFGASDISDAINKFTSSFGKIADWISKNIVPIVKNTLIPVLKNVLSVVKNVVEFIANNKWVQDTLMGIVGAMLAFKAVNTVKSAIVGIISPIASMTKNLVAGVSAFKSAWSAGLSFSSAMGSVATNTTGAVSGVASLTSKVTGLVNAVGGLAGVAGIGAIVTSVIWDVNAIMTANEMATTKATTAARDYARRVDGVEQATRSLNIALQNESGILDDIKAKLDEQSSAELEYLESKKLAAEYEKNYNELKAAGTATTDELREAELKRNAAIKDRDDKQKKLNKTIEETSKLEDEYFGNQITGINETNHLITRQELLSGQYRTVAQQLDNLAKSTVTYKDANGNLATATEEQTRQMADWTASRLTSVSETWKKIYDLSVSEGISLTEATGRIGEDASYALDNNFAFGVYKYQPLATDATTQTTQAIKDILDKNAQSANESGMRWTDRLAVGISSTISTVEAAGKSAANSAKSGAESVSVSVWNKIGAAITNGIAKGADSAKGAVFSTMASIVSTAVQKAKEAGMIHSPSRATAEVGKFLSLGLAKGIDDYADEAIDAAESMTERTISAMNADYNPNLSMAQLQPQTGLQNAQNGSQNQVVQYNDFTVDSELDVNEISKRLGWQVATAL